MIATGAELRAWRAGLRPGSRVGVRFAPDSMRIATLCGPSLTLARGRTWMMVWDERDYETGEELITYWPEWELEPLPHPEARDWVHLEAPGKPRRRRSRRRPADRARA